MNAVAVTEPDFGSDVAGVKVTATPTDGGWLHQRREDVVHLRRPGRRADAAGPHRPRPLERPPRPVAVHRAQAARRRPRLRARPAGRTAPGGGKMEGRADRHHRLPRHALLRGRLRRLVRARPRTSIGGEDGLGRGFYYQMAGFENGRLQTAARAVGVMQAAYEAARQYAAGPGRVRPADRRLPAHPGQARPHGRASSRPPASSPTRSPG